MATDLIKEIREGRDTASNLAASAATLAPLGLGAYVGFKRIQANNPIRASHLQSGKLNEIARGVGQRLRRESVRRDAESARHVEEIQRQLLQSDSAQKLIDTTQKQKAVVQSLLSTLEDPSAGVDPQALMSYRQQLLDIVDGELDPDQMRETLVNLMKTVAEGSETTKSRFARYQRQFSDVADQIVLPDFEFKASMPFKPLNEPLQGKAYGRYQQLIKMFGPGTDKNIEVGQVGNSVYARLYSGGPGPRRFVTSVPLALAQGEGLRTGEAFGTHYSTGQSYVDAQKAFAYLQGSGSKSLPGLQQAAGVPLEDYFLKELGGRVAARPGGQIGIRDRRGFNAFMTESLEAGQRMMMMGGSAGSPVGRQMAHHIRQATALKQRTMTFVGMQNLTQENQLALLRGAVMETGLDPGVGAERILGGRIRDALGQRQYGTLGIPGGALAALKTGGITDRLSLPVTARAEQVIGRTSMFVDPVRQMGVGGVFQGGAGRAIGWGPQLTGTINKAVLLDVSGDLSRIGAAAGPLAMMEGGGQAYATRVGRLMSEGTIPVFDPAAHKGTSSKLLNRLMRHAQEKPGELLYLSRDQIEQHKGFLGIGAQGAKHLPTDPRMTGMHIGLERKVSSHGKHMLHFAYAMEREMETGKVFGTQFKGTVAHVEESQFRSRLQADYGVTDKFLQGTGVTLGDVLVAPGSMLKKAPDYLHRQLISGFGLVSGQANPFDFVADRAGKLGTTMGKTERITRVVAGELARRGVGAEAAGRVLAGVLHTKSAVSVEQVEDIISTTFGSRADRVLSVARRGLAIGADAFAAGTGVGDYGRGRGSLEVRGFQMLQSRLVDMGLSTNQVADFIGDLYKSKIGMGEGFKSLVGLTNLVQSMTGTASIRGQQAAKVLGIGDVVDHMMRAPKGQNTLSALLRSNPEGVLLDLASMSGTPTGEAIRFAAEQQFGGAAQLHLPGRDVLDAMRGTTIKTAEGAIGVGSQFDRHLDEFGRNLMQVYANQRVAKEEADEAFRIFRSNVSDLYGHAAHRIASGKIRGSAMSVAQGYNIDKDFALDSRRQKFLAEVVKKTDGKAVFMDTRGFLSAMKDWRGGETDMRRQLQDFFVSSERLHASEARGIMGVSARNPILSKGNIDVVQYFRHLGETGKRSGFAWEAMKTAKVQEQSVLDIALAKAGLGSDVRGFVDLADPAKVSQGQRQEFFTVMAKHLQSFVNWDGGGQIYQPQGHLKLKVDTFKDSVKIDLGLASQAGGDWDGDQWLSFLLNEKQRKTVASTIGTGTQADYLARDALYKIQSQVYESRAKEHLKTLGGDVRLTAEEQAAEDMLKESGTKRGTGMVDVKLNDLRRAVLDNAAGNERLANEGLAMLKVLQEHTVIKGKKLPVYRPFAEQLTSSVNQMLDGQGSQAFKMFLEENVFGGAQHEVWSGLGATAGPDAPQYVQKALDGKVVQLDELVKFIHSSAENYRSSPGNLVSGSGGSIARAVKHAELGPAAMRDLGQALGITQQALQSGWAGDQLDDLFSIAGQEANTIRSLGRRFNANALGPMALGAVASMVVGSMFGDQGYGSRALDMPGAISDGRVSSAIASGSLFNTGQMSPVGDDFAQGSQYAQFGGTINVPQTYMTQRNGYQIRGEIPNILGVSEVNSYVNSLLGGGGGGSVRINDSRRPITSAYADRVLGVY